MLARVVRVLKASVENSGSGSRIESRTPLTLAYLNTPLRGFPIGFHRIGATLEESEGFLVHSESLTVRSMERKPFRREYEGLYPCVVSQSHLSSERQPGEMI